jgi:sortase A
VNGLRNLERLLLVAGILMLAFLVAARLHQTLLVDAALQQFKDQQTATEHKPRPVMLTSAVPNFNLWSEQRIKGYEESLMANFAPAIAILRIPRIHVEVPVLEGTDDLSLNRGVGHVPGTANPDEKGNVAIAGHRDGFFRGLKDVALGDRIEMDTTQGTKNYLIDRITIVDRNDVSVLKSRSRASLTLVTCYPFYFVGSAPKRYVVQAFLVDSDSAHAHARSDSKSDPIVSNQQAAQSEHFE